jgi:hypothetical protein
VLFAVLLTTKCHTFPRHQNNCEIIFKTRSSEPQNNQVHRSRSAFFPQLEFLHEETSPSTMMEHTAAPGAVQAIWFGILGVIGGVFVALVAVFAKRVRTRRLAAAGVVASKGPHVAAGGVAGGLAGKESASTAAGASPFPALTGDDVPPIADPFTASGSGTDTFAAADYGHFGGFGTGGLGSLLADAAIDIDWDQVRLASQEAKENRAKRKTVLISAAAMQLPRQRGAPSTPTMSKRRAPSSPDSELSSPFSRSKMFSL